MLVPILIKLIFLLIIIGFHLHVLRLVVILRREFIFNYHFDK